MADVSKKRVFRPNHHGRKLYWTYERIKQEASKYEYLVDFMNKSSVAYHTAVTKKILKDVTINLRRKTFEERFWEKVDKTSGCWNWKAGKNKVSGYGVFQINAGTRLAHRISYELCVEKIPNNLVIDHLCKNRACVNPNHLEVVTPKINALRSDSPPALNAKKSTCPRGHKYDYSCPKGWRKCKTCQNINQRISRQKKKEVK